TQNPFFEFFVWARGKPGERHRDSAIALRCACFTKHHSDLIGAIMPRLNLEGVFSTKLLKKLAASVLLALVSLLTPPVFAQSGSDALTFFKNYFVTGDYVVGGVGLRGRGDATGYATGTISIPDQNSIPAGGVPTGADIVAAFLYWQTVEKSQSMFAGQKGFFN